MADLLIFGANDRQPAISVSSVPDLVVIVSAWRNPNGPQGEGVVSLLTKASTKPKPGLLNPITTGDVGMALLAELNHFCRLHPGFRDIAVGVLEQERPQDVGADETPR